MQNRAITPISIKVLEIDSQGSTGYIGDQHKIKGLLKQNSYYSKSSVELGYRRRKKFRIFQLVSIDVMMASLSESANATVPITVVKWIAQPPAQVGAFVIPVSTAPSFRGESLQSRCKTV